MPDGTVIHGPDGIRKYLGRGRTSLLTVYGEAFFYALGRRIVGLIMMTSTGLFLSYPSMITVPGVGSSSHCQ